MYEIHEKCFKCINFNNICGDCIGDKYACPEYEEYSSELAIRKIVNYYDFKMQRNQFSEEMAEAILAITKMIRHARDIPKYKECFANFAEEVADVLVMVQQMRLYLGENLIDGIIDEKLKRQLRRIKEEKYDC